MIAHPTAAELLDAVIGFIETRAAPQLSGRDAFLARVAVNALATVRRELAEGDGAEARAVERLAAILGRDDNFEALNADLSERLREGALEADEAVLTHLRTSAVDQIRIDQPNYSGLQALLEP